ncbi:response regulator transcription factor [Streptomyces sp. NPDC047061]|uniref:helix-turn-helix transcriptional regulator n=1 Tax=Streptomyces sp. NPDC047061 TaxID=3154605 RepID=UPI0033E4A290
MTVRASDPISREGVLGLLRCHPEMDVREEPTTEPGTVAVHVQGLFDDAALTRLRRVAQDEKVRVVLVVRALCDPQLLDVLASGAAGVVWRHEATSQRLAQAVLAAARGDVNLPTDLLGRVVDQATAVSRQAGGGSDPFVAGLAPREKDVLRLIADGHTTVEIAAELSCSPRTVKTVTHRLTSRLELRNREHAVAYALREGHI